LDGIPPSRRGVPQIEVTFDIDANGIINVSAKDKATNKEQSVRIEASSGLSEQDIERMKQEAEANADADKAVKEKVEVLNRADSLIFSTEAQIKEFEDKLTEDQVGQLQVALNELKDAHKAEDVDLCNEKSEALTEVWNQISQAMYAAQSQSTEDGEETIDAEVVED